MSNSNYCVLVQSTDSYEDCWYPFFKLFSIYWPNYKGRIYLTTESKSFTYPGLKIITNQVDSYSKNKVKTWSESLLRSLEMIHEEYILFILEDLFLNRAVNEQMIKKFVHRMEIEKISILYLTDQSTSQVIYNGTNDDIIEVDQNANNRISALTAIWNKKAFYKYLIPRENP